MRLATLAEEKEIAVTLGDIMAMDWVNGNRYVEALEICREILQSGEDYRILGTLFQDFIRCCWGATVE